MQAVLRMIDANANRAREALRVLEDAARFGLNDADLCGRLKSLRHDLRAALDALPVPPGALVANRDALHDAGAAHDACAEFERSGLADLVTAAGKRLGESMRSLEEAAKVFAAHVAARLKSIRYQGYELEKAIVLRLASGRAVQWRLCLILTRSLCAAPWRHVLAGALDAGVDCVQVREKGVADGELIEHVRQVIEMSKNRAAVVVNDRVDIALVAGAHGVHLGQEDLSVVQARAIAGRQLIIGVSTHAQDEADRAISSGADYCGVGAMFPTSIKPDRAPSGVGYLQVFLDRYPRVAHLAIGGITPRNASAVVSSGARGLAVSTAICAAEDPRAAAQSLLDVFKSPVELSQTASLPRSPAG